MFVHRINHLTSHSAQIILLIFKVRMNEIENNHSHSYMLILTNLKFLIMLLDGISMHLPLSTTKSNTSFIQHPTLLATKLQNEFNLPSFHQ